MCLKTKPWRCGVVAITTAQLHSPNPELRFCTSSNPACCVSEIRDCEDLWQWSRLEIRLNTFHRSTITQKQLIKNKQSVTYGTDLVRLEQWTKCRLLVVPRSRNRGILWIIGYEIQRHEWVTQSLKVSVK